MVSNNNFRKTSSAAYKGKPTHFIGFSRPKWFISSLPYKETLVFCDALWAIQCLFMLHNVWAISGFPRELPWRHSHPSLLFLKSWNIIASRLQTEWICGVICFRSITHFCYGVDLVNHGCVKAPRRPLLTYEREMLDTFKRDVFLYTFFLSGTMKQNKI